MTRRRRGYVSWVVVLPTGVATTVDAGRVDVAGVVAVAVDFEGCVFDAKAAADAWSTSSTARYPTPMR